MEAQMDILRAHVRLPLLTGLFQSQLDGRIVVLLLFQAQDFPLPFSFSDLLFYLPLRLAVQSQQARAQRLVQSQEDVPVVVDVEEIVGFVAAAQLLCCCVAEQQLGLGGAPAAGDAVVLFGGAFLEIHLLFLLLLLHIRQLTPLREQHVRDEVVDDLLDLVFVFLLNTGLPLDVVDDERRCVLQDLAVLICQREVGARGWSGVLFRRLLLALHNNNKQMSVFRMLRSGRSKVYSLVYSV